MRRFGIVAGIRAVAFGMIILPEPVTTVLGVAILGATFAASRPKSLKKFGDLEGLIRESKQTYRPQGFRRCFDQNMVNDPLNLEYPSPISGDHEKTQTVDTPLPYHSWFDNRKVSQEVIYHTLKTSFPQYEAGPPIKTGSLKDKDSMVEYHRLKLDFASRT